MVHYLVDPKVQLKADPKVGQTVDEMVQRTAVPTAGVKAHYLVPPTVDHWVVHWVHLTVVQSAHCWAHWTARHSVDKKARLKADPKVDHSDPRMAHQLDVPKAD